MYLLIEGSCQPDPLPAAAGRLPPLSPQDGRGQEHEGQGHPGRQGRPDVQQGAGQQAGQHWAQVQPRIKEIFPLSEKKDWYCIS